MNNITTSTTISHEAWQQIKLNKWRVNELIMLGISAKMNNPQLIDRIKELEAGNDRLQKRLTSLYNEVYK